PTVKPVIPTGIDVSSVGEYGETQVGTPVFTAGDPLVPMDDSVRATFEDGSTTLTIPGEGTYTVAPDGTVTFVPAKGFTGEGTGVIVKRFDVNGTSVTAKFVPKVGNYTIYIDTEGNALTPDENGNIPNYELVETKVDAKGNTIHIYKKIPASPKVNESVKENVHYKKMLPNTGESDKVFLPQALLSILLGMILLITSKRNKKEE
ncbi:LPXTG cell wall anchor domain-containing protein, partial [Streptococcus zalophi]